MQINNVGQALDQISVFPRDPLTKRDKSDHRSNGVSAESMFGDSIGTESSVDVLNEDEFPKSLTKECKSHVIEAKNRESTKAERHEFPPPIPLLAQTENLQARMPWILRRRYTGDGRLVLTEVNNRHHEYFRTNRCNGRLTFQLVSVGVSDACGESDEGEEESDRDQPNSDGDQAKEEEDRDQKTYDRAVRGRQ